MCHNFVSLKSSPYPLTITNLKRYWFRFATFFLYLCNKITHFTAKPFYIYNSYICSMIILIISFLLNMITFMISFHLSEEIIDLEETVCLPRYQCGKNIRSSADFNTAYTDTLNDVIVSLKKNWV